MIECEGDSLPARISLLDYLEQHGWKPVRSYARGEVAGLCPWHQETRPSLFVNRYKQVFYCHGCGRGGGLARLKRLLEIPPVLPAPRSDAAELLQVSYSFYQEQLLRHPAGGAYLARRGIHDPGVIAALRIGYAPGACLRGHLTRLGFDRQAMIECGLLDRQGRDGFFHCLTFPLERAGNLYGRSIGDAFWRHRFLPRPKGGLFGWERAHLYSSVIVVEGLFDLASLWQAGFGNAVSTLGAHLNSLQLAELCGATDHTVYLCLDGDPAGQRAANGLLRRLQRAGVEALRVVLPPGHDPNSFLAAGAGASEFQRLVDRARP